MKLLFGAVVVLSLALSSASAWIPPYPPPNVGWLGPGFFCEAGYVLRLEAGEQIRKDMVLEPWYPISVTIQSETGWYSLAYLDTQNPVPDRKERGNRIAIRKSDVIYKYAHSDFDEVARYIFLPRRKDVLPDAVEGIKLTFRKTPGELRAIDRSDYASVIGRIELSNSRPQSCLNDRDPVQLK